MFGNWILPIRAVNNQVKKNGRLWKEKSSFDPWAAITFSGCVGLKRRMCSPFCHEDAARYTNLHKMINNVVTMNMRAHELVSGYIAGIANSDTEFHIKYAPYTLGEHNNTSIIIRKGGGERKRQHSEKMFFAHKMNFACAANWNCWFWQLKRN